MAERDTKVHKFSLTRYPQGLCGAEAREGLSVFIADVDCKRCRQMARRSPRKKARGK